MKREWKKLPLEYFFREVPDVRRDDIIIGIDKKNYEEIMTLLTENQSHLNRFKRILYSILNEEHDKDLYGREDVSSKACRIYAMKFQKKDNLRIYCKEFKNGKRIIMIQAHFKKGQMTKRNKEFIENLGRYEYDI